MLQEVLAIELLNDSLVSKKRTLCNSEESAEMKFVDSFMNFCRESAERLDGRIICGD